MKKFFNDLYTFENTIRIALAWAVIHIFYSALWPEIENAHTFVSWIPGIVFSVVVFGSIANDIRLYRISEKKKLEKKQSEDSVKFNYVKF